MHYAPAGKLLTQIHGIWNDDDDDQNHNIYKNSFGIDSGFFLIKTQHYKQQ